MNQVNPRSIHANRPICGVIPVHNDEPGILNVLTQLKRAAIPCALFVLNGCTETYRTNLEQALRQLQFEYDLLEFRDPLGLDVPRAIGAIAALRKRKQWVFEYVACVDGDWLGGFGPTLEDICQTALRHKSDVLCMPHHPLGSSEPTSEPRVDMKIWSHVTTHLGLPHMARACPAQMPLLLRLHCFDVVPAYWLHHPGLWFARVLKNASRLSVHVYPHDVSRSIGNPTRNRGHGEQLKITLIGDALEGARYALGKKTSREWQGRLFEGYHLHRRIDVLGLWQSQLTSTST